nr:AMP-binding protein [Clostridia bacterium]
MFDIPDSMKMFSSDSLTRDSSVWQQSLVLVFDDDYSEEDVADAIRTYIKNNDSFGIGFVNRSTGTKIDISPFTSMDIPVTECGSYKDVLVFAQNEANRPLTTDGELFRANVVRFEKKIGAICTIHHALVDGYSGILFIKGISEILKGKPSPESSIKNHIEDELKYKNTDRYRKDISFWNKMISENRDNERLFRTQDQTVFDTFSRWFTVPEHICEKAALICKDHEFPESVFWYSATAAFLSRQFDADKFNLGIALLNRVTQNDLNTFGLFMHVVPLMLSVDDRSFLRLAEQISDSLMTLMRHEKLSAYSISQDCGNGLYRNTPLFEVAVDYSPIPDFEGVSHQIIYSGTCSVPLEIHLFRIKNNGLKILIRYARDVFADVNAGNFEASFYKFILQIADSPKKRISQYDILTDKQRKILNEFSTGPAAPIPEKCVHELIEEQSRRTPDKEAVTAADRTVTYRELNEESCRIANGLIARGILPGDTVAFCLPRKSYLISAMTGILKTGASYLPIDPDYPEDRIGYMLSDSGAKYFITEENISELISYDNTDDPDIS